MDNKLIQHFIITFGPAGSGKGHIIENEIEDVLNCLYQQEINLSNPKQTYMALVDNLIENDETYRRESYKIFINSYYYKKGQKPRTKTGKITKNFQNLSENLSKLYFNIRKKYDKINDNAITKALKNKKNIILETTGQNQLDWIWSWLFKDYKLNEIPIITIVYPWKTRKGIIDGIITRFETQVNEIEKYIEKNSKENFFQNKKIKPIRLPNLAQLRDNIPIIEQNFAKIIGQNMSKIENILIYDNNYELNKNSIFLFGPKLTGQRIRTKPECKLVNSQQKLSEFFTNYPSMHKDLSLMIKAYHTLFNSLYPSQEN
jgi:hypothetical protein